jgi:hypothetical protein
LPRCPRARPERVLPRWTPLHWTRPGWSGRRRPGWPPGQSFFPLDFGYAGETITAGSMTGSLDRIFLSPRGALCFVHESRHTDPDTWYRVVQVIRDHRRMYQLVRLLGVEERRRSALESVQQFAAFSETMSNYRAQEAQLSLSQAAGRLGWISVLLAVVALVIGGIQIYVAVAP